MNLREEVKDVIESAMIDGWQSMKPGASLWQHNVQQQTRAAITAMREALLSEPVVEAAGRALVEQSETGMTAEEEATIALTAALAAMGAVTED